MVLSQDISASTFEACVHKLNWRPVLNFQVNHNTLIVGPVFSIVLREEFTILGSDFDFLKCGRVKLKK